MTLITNHVYNVCEKLWFKRIYKHVFELLMRIDMEKMKLIFLKLLTNVSSLYIYTTHPK